MDHAHLYNYIIRPTLDYMGYDGQAAEVLLLGTALTESNGGQHVRQIDGPALGIFQMEPATHDDIWDNWLKFRVEQAVTINTLVGVWPPGANSMVGNNCYAAAMARTHYLRQYDPLPQWNDQTALAEYWKEFYNSHVGKGTVKKAIPAFRKAIEIVAAR